MMERGLKSFNMATGPTIVKFPPYHVLGEHRAAWLNLLFQVAEVEEPDIEAEKPKKKKKKRAEHEQ